jgi:hypothetical protein
MGFTTPNQRLTGQHVGHSSSPPVGTPSDGFGVPGRGMAHPGNAAPPNNDAARFKIPNTDPTGGFPTAPTQPGRGSVPVNPWTDSGTPAIGARTPDDAATLRNANRR